ncbi:siderophore ABC transporter substrate-binding protein [Microvirga mediterraneensis]|uniref:Siderophore ABC transporter substrate-binding protein n=1 Tax=Microvirga mediterraneensis TaxID=2754695 RepID=A0A838BLZ0_9HYPH|nr:siderophore ABC transporter substrate-binding protein [Microvirga mediterraneensis]MBA1155953.1 siderophore ABC transporter substrate-binding protein [Microvirga mediterraneensis]
MMTFAARCPLAALLAGALALGSLTGSAQAQDLTIQHAKGETTVPRKPRKVLAFDMASLDTLNALGVEVSGVPTARFPEYLAKYGSDQYEKVGTLFEPDYEAVNAAEPDLIVVGGRSSAKYADLAKIAPTIDLTVDPKDFMSGVKRNVRILGKIFDKEAEAETQLTKLETSMADLRRNAAKAGSGLLVLTTGGKMSAYGPGSRFGILHDEFGLAPAVEGLATTSHGQAVSAEFILKTNPDWLFVIDRDVVVGRDGGAAKKVLDNELVAQTSAWKQNQVVYLDPVDWYLVGGGLTALQASVDQIAKAVTKK